MAKKIVKRNLMVILLMVSGFVAYNMLANAGNLLTPGQKPADNDGEFISMSIVGPFSPGSEATRGFEGESEILKLDHLITVPLDQGSGQASRATVHSPLRVVKTIDKASPGLHKALCTGQNLAEVIFDFYRAKSQTEQGSEVYYKITLRNVRLVEIGPSTDFINPDSYRHMENVSFIYQEIEWYWVPEGIVVKEQWDS